MLTKPLGPSKLKELRNAAGLRQDDQEIEKYQDIKKQGKISKRLRGCSNLDKTGESAIKTTSRSCLIEGVC